MNRDLTLLAISLLTWGTGESMFLYFQPLYLQKLGAEPVNIGSLLGPTLGGRIADQVGLRSIYFIAGSIFIISFCIVLLIRPQPLEHATLNEKGFGLEIDRRYAAFLVFFFITMFVAYLPQPLSSNFLHNVHALSYSQIGQLGSISALGMVIMSVTLGRLNTRVGFIAGQAAVAIFTLLLWQGNDLLLFAAGYIFLGGYRIAHTMASAQLNEMVHQSRMGLAYGLTETVFSSVTMLAPPMAGYLYEINPSLTYSVSFGLIIVSMMLSAVYFFGPTALSGAMIRKVKRNMP